MRRSYAGKGGRQWLLPMSALAAVGWNRDGGRGYRVFGSAFAYGERLTGALQINFVSLRVSHDICIKACWWQQGVCVVGGIGGTGGSGSHVTCLSQLSISAQS